MNKFPQVTIIMATYNRASLILETVQSIQSQSCENFECLIIDDGGRDNTIEVIASVLEQDKRFQFLKRPDIYLKGVSGCRNYGLDLAKGEYVIFFDDDDFVHPENLKTCLEVIESNKVDFCHYQKMSYEIEKPIIENHPTTIQQNLLKDDIEKVVTQKIGLASCTILWKKDCFDKNRFDESLLYAEEWECYIRLISKDFKGVIISNVLYYNRKHPNSNTAEFYRDNPIRRASKKDAIILVIINLKEKELLSYSILRYFVKMALEFKEYELFNQILKVLELTPFEKLKWQLFYFTLPLRLFVYKIKTSIKKNNN
jgi:GalNAc5-diNAcBac-PP-undecaprenol beta-1,3-glucosyltransferase